MGRNIVVLYDDPKIIYIIPTSSSQCGPTTNWRSRSNYLKATITQYTTLMCGPLIEICNKNGKDYFYFRIALLRIKVLVIHLCLFQSPNLICHTSEVAYTLIL